MGCCTINVSGDILHANRMTGDLLGIDRDSLISRRFSSFIREDDRQPFRELLDGLRESDPPRSGTWAW